MGQGETVISGYVSKLWLTLLWLSSVNRSATDWQTRGKGQA